MNLINDEMIEKINKAVINHAREGKYELSIKNILDIHDLIHASIPGKKRISIGTYSVVKQMGETLFDLMIKRNLQVYTIGYALFKRADEKAQHRAKGVALRALSLYGLTDYKKVLPVLETAASSSHWELREFAAGFIHVIIKEFPREMQRYLINLSQSEDPNLRRFVSESLRPVKENRWIFKDPGYSLSVLKGMFRESHAYARTSVGNNLSDLARRLPELVYSLVEELVASGDKNSYWIAYRACRNLVKKEPLRVMNLLGVDEYKYKKRIHKRKNSARYFITPTIG
jgi:3-methyladenine DNA glycosylase AlkC